MTALQIVHLSFTHDSAAHPLFLDLTLHLTRGWTGVVGPNGSGKTTFLHLVQGTLQPQEGVIRGRGRLALCPQRTDDPPEGWREFLDATEARAARLRGILGVSSEWAERWETLSHGERKRAQIGTALWTEPDVLMVDEPTNHLDTAAMEELQKSLHEYTGIGLLVSHDRALLDALCTNCVWLTPPAARLLPGNYSTTRELIHREDQSRAHEREVLKREIRRLEGISRDRRHEARQADAKKSKRHLHRHDSDGRAKIGLAIVSGKDGVAGKLDRQIQHRLTAKQESLASMPVKKNYTLDFWLPTGVSTRNQLFHLPAGAIPLGESATLAFPDLFMGPRDRIALCGPNGSGKSLLVRHLLTRLTLPAARVLYLPQEIHRDESDALLRSLKSLSNAELGTVCSVISCLGSRPERLLESSSASPGEIRKLRLARGIALEPHLIVLDEPTNHLDLDAIELLEQALAGCPCGLLLVSHDRRFRERLTSSTWTILPGGAHHTLVPG